MNLSAEAGAIIEKCRVVEEGVTFCGIYEAHYARIYSYVRYRVFDFHDAEDLVSKIFEKAFYKLDSYRAEKGTIAAWLFTITRNTIKDYYRKMARFHSAPLETIEDSACTEIDFDGKLILCEIKQQLYDALMALSHREQAIIALKFRCDMSNREIACLLDISESNTGIILFRAMRRLRKILEAQGVGIIECGIKSEIFTQAM